MSQEWVALVASGTVSVAVAVAGAVTAIWIATLNRDTTLQLAREERKQQRLSSAYIEILSLVHRIGYWASRVRPLMDTNPPQERPLLPSPEEQARMEALVTAFGSKEVRDLKTEWWKEIAEILLRDEDIAYWQKDGGDDSGGEQASWKALRKHQKAEPEMRRALGEQIAKELEHPST